MAHKLRGGTGSLGAVDLSGLAGEVEASLREEADPGRVDALAANLEAEAHRIQRLVASLAGPAGRLAPSAPIVRRSGSGSGSGLDVVAQRGPARQQRADPLRFGRAPEQVSLPEVTRGLVQPSCLAWRLDALRDGLEAHDLAHLNDAFHE